ncbi:MAG: LPS assembly lipoprotein LptE [Lysobacteraceae bacterium]
MAVTTWRKLAASMALAAALLLVGCGFHLRRELVLPEELRALRIESADPHGALTHGLEQALRRAGASLVSDPAQADAARLLIGRSQVTQRPISVGATGRVQEFALQSRAEIELLDVHGVARVPRQTVMLERVYSFDGAAALGTPGEEEAVREELEREMVSAVLRRIEAALREREAAGE